ncbi:lipopolysaccharide export system permease protein [Persephonella hydrogeniphila]|uniref:Lipopolysaccharide export system permease protein n=1 Tax=Persephonella hydrogeniphila TaxID=198703 RepID=A0A285MZM4_9AQUI|nr:LptF/LptG family permease [Persephonella hydrogeniphila]SNZ02133.1 lipopolysaccharide export system permease protein [Persephonella hydrogeniphila]
MKILYRYLSFNIIKYFFILVGFFSVIIVSSQLLHLPSILYHAGIIKFFQILIFVNLSFLKYQLLFGFFIAAVIVGYTIRENREIYAIYSSGVSKKQLLYPVFFVSILFFILSIFISFIVVPYANRERAQFITLNVKKHILDSIVEKNFMKLSDDITIYVHEKDENRMRYIFIHNRKKRVTITAEEANFSDNRLILKNGYIQLPSQDGFNLLKFEKYRFVLDVKYIKKYEFEDLENKILLKIIKENRKLKNRALAVLTDRAFYGIPFVFVGVLGFFMGIQLYKSRDTLISIAVIISILYLVMNTYFIKLIQKGSINPVIYGVMLIIYFGILTAYFYKKR